MLKLFIGLLLLAVLWYFFKTLRATMRGESKVSKAREKLIDAKTQSQVLDVEEEAHEISTKNAARESALNTENTEEKIK